ncbi:MAG: hypothetical protein JSU92_02510 [Deltaproteobacteria bacterium]|nr:MAG: hypothetical protein JSU92_02510 [Deltaproteobacteria bacterium]
MNAKKKGILTMAKWKKNNIILVLFCILILTGIGLGYSKGCKSSLKDFLTKEQASTPSKDLQEITPFPPDKEPETEEQAEKEAKIKDLDIKFLEAEEDSKKMLSEEEREKIISSQAPKTRQPEDGSISTIIEGKPEGEEQEEPPEEGREEELEKEGEQEEEKTEDEETAPDSDTVTAQLYEIGLEDVTVYEFVTNFTVLVNVYYDSQFCAANNSFGGYVLQITYDPTVVKVGTNALDDCSGDNPITGSSGKFATPGPEFDAAPTITFCDNIAGSFQFWGSQGTDANSPCGLINVGNITFTRIGLAGTGTDLTINTVFPPFDFCSYNTECYSSGTAPPSYPWPVFPNYIKNGRVDVVSAPAPEIVGVDNDGVCCDNNVVAGYPSTFSIYGSGFMPGHVMAAGQGCIDNGAGCACFDGLPDEETEVCIEGGGLVLGFQTGQVLSGGEITTSWFIKEGPGGPLNLYVENPDGTVDSWGPSFGDPGLSIF